MQAEELLRQGRLEDALADLEARVRQDPSHLAGRVFLFQLMCVLGQWARASTQLGALQRMDPQLGPLAQGYLSALACERQRAEVFAGRQRPTVLGEPPVWLAELIQALQLEAQGQAAPAEAMRARAFEAAPATPGQLDGQLFEWLADADDRLGPVLEAFVQGRYYWIPMARVRTLRLERPGDLRDLVWLPATFVWTNGGEAGGLIPVRYPGTELAQDGLLRLGRRTEWTDGSASPSRPVGQRVFVTDAAEHALLDVRQIDLSGCDENAGDADG